MYEYTKIYKKNKEIISNNKYYPIDLYRSLIGMVSEMRLINNNKCLSKLIYMFTRYFSHQCDE